MFGTTSDKIHHWRESSGISFESSFSRASEDLKFSKKIIPVSSSKFLIFSLIRSERAGLEKNILKLESLQLLSLSGINLLEKLVLFSVVAPL